MSSCSLCRLASFHPHRENESKLSGQIDTWTFQTWVESVRPRHISVYDTSAQCLNKLLQATATANMNIDLYEKLDVFRRMR